MLFFVPALLAALLALPAGAAASVKAKSATATPAVMERAPKGAAEETAAAKGAAIKDAAAKGTAIKDAAAKGTAIKDAAAKGAAAEDAAAEKGASPVSSAPPGQRHIVLLQPVVPRSMPSDVVEEMTARLARDFHVPLNGTLRAVTYAGEDEVQRAMKLIYEGKGSLPERIRATAEATDADYIAGFLITNYDESSYYNWKSDLVLHSYVSLQLIGYDRERGLVLDLPASRSYNGEYTRSGTARILALFEFDRLMEKADFRSTLFPVADWLDQPRENRGKPAAANGSDERKADNA